MRGRATRKVFTGFGNEGGKFRGHTGVSSRWTVSLHPVLKVSRQINDISQSLLVDLNWSWQRLEAETSQEGIAIVQINNNKN